MITRHNKREEILDQYLP